ncbi:unnamed protein product, partial [Amoebophrya sp. A25]
EVHLSGIENATVFGQSSSSGTTGVGVSPRSLAGFFLHDVERWRMRNYYAARHGHAIGSTSTLPEGSNTRLWCTSQTKEESE